VERYLERHPEHRKTSVEARARATVELVLARTHRAAYVAHLGRALRGDPGGVVRELRTLGRILARGLIARFVRRISRRAAP
jgi:hypothetical protein